MLGGVLVMAGAYVGLGWAVLQQSDRVVALVGAPQTWAGAVITVKGDRIRISRVAGLP